MKLFVLRVKEDHGNFELAPLLARSLAHIDTFYDVTFCRIPFSPKTKMTAMTTITSDRMHLFGRIHIHWIGSWSCTFLHVKPACRIPSPKTKMAATATLSRGHRRVHPNQRWPPLPHSAQSEPWFAHGDALGLG